MQCEVAKSGELSQNVDQLREVHLAAPDGERDGELLEGLSLRGRRADGPDVESGQHSPALSEAQPEIVTMVLW